MTKLILTVGAPGSGKSTWAKNRCNDIKAIDINRDDIRCEMFNCSRNEYKATKANERTVLAKQQSLFIDAALNSSIIYDEIIISDTNLNPKTRSKWEELANQFCLEIEYKLFDVDLETLYERNLYRGENAVPNHMIYRFYEKMQHYIHGKPDWSKNKDLPAAIIVDIDGTLADNNKRNPHDLDKLHTDSPRQNVINAVNLMHAAGIKVLITSGREEGDFKVYRESTEKWLSKYNVSYDSLIMREHKDHRKDAIVKKELFYKYIADRYNVLYVLDDRQQVVDMWRVLGLECWQVNRGDF